MKENRFTLISKFSCCGKSMVTVIMDGAACVMDEWEYRKLIYLERNVGKKNILMKSA